MKPENPLREMIPVRLDVLLREWHHWCNQDQGLGFKRRSVGLATGGLVADSTDFEEQTDSYAISALDTIWWQLPYDGRLVIEGIFGWLHGVEFKMRRDPAESLQNAIDQLVEGLRAKGVAL